jgi:hypothetical protein
MSRLLVHEEIPADDIGLRLQLPRVRQVVSGQHYVGCPVCIIFDPAGVAKSQHDELTSFDVIKQFGFMAMAAPSNRLAPRLNAVERFLNEARAGTAAMLINRSKCPTLVTGFNGAYRFKYNQQGESQPAPDKNKYSHVHDAMQYLAMAASGGTAAAIARRITRARAQESGQLRRPRVSSAGWT